MHIFFGITLLLQNLLLSVCQQIDHESNTENESVGDDGQREWLQRSMVLSEENQELKQIGEDVVEIEYRIGRMKLYYKGSNWKKATGKRQLEQQAAWRNI